MTTLLASRRRRHIGLVYQFYNLIPILDVEDNIKLPILLDKSPIDQADFDTLLDKLMIRDRRTHLPSELSVGQQQRVSIARTLINRPLLLLLDEPTGNLDQKASKEIIDTIKESHKLLNQTTILITHDENIACQADRMINIEDGQIIFDEV